MWTRTPGEPLEADHFEPRPVNESFELLAHLCRLVFDDQDLVEMPVQAHVSLDVQLERATL